MSRGFPWFSLCARAVMGLIFVVLALLDPFGLSSSSDQASEQWLNRMFASRYEGKGQHEIAVVLLDDAYLQRNQTYWPLPYDEQSKLFKRLLAFKPGAVFVDFLYSHDHSADDPLKGSQLLANVFDRYQRRGIPLFLANTGQVRGHDGQANTIQALNDVSMPALVAWSGMGERYPLAVDTPLGAMETPALALYRQYCSKHGCAGLPSDTTTALATPPVAIQWGLEVPPEQADVANAKDCAVSGSVSDEFWKQLSRAMFWRLGGNDDERPVCRYTLTLTASDLEVTDEADRALIARLLAGRMVLVGANITSAGDLTESPVHGQVPGVFLHAMALDNLITMGMDYDRDPASFGSTDINWLDLFGLLLIGVIAGLKAFHTRIAHKTRFKGWLTRIRVEVLSRLLSWGVLLAFLWLLSRVLNASHYTPVNVLGVLLISLVLVGEAFRPLPKIIIRRYQKGI